MKNRNILISGASVAGPALAYWLSRYRFNPTVVERAPAPRDGGYAVDFRGASVELLDRMGILGDARQAATNMGDISYVDSDGKVLAVAPSVIFSGELEILRGDLVDILYRAAMDDVEYVFGDSITAIAQADDGVRVTFERSEPRTFDLVVGADGLHSNTRALVCGDESQFTRDFGLYVSVFTTSNHLNLDHTGHFYNVPGKTVGIYSARDNAEAKAYFAFASPPLDHDRRDTEQQKKILADTFAGEGWEVPRLLETMCDAPDFYFDSMTQIHMHHLSKGRVALVGDAGYCAAPLSGMGTSLAMVGAYVLAGELTAAAGDHSIAFARYEEEMRPYVKACQKQAEGSDTWFVPRTNTMIWLRNLNFRIMPYMPWKGLIARMALKAANAITLKNYPY